MDRGRLGVRTALLLCLLGMSAEPGGGVANSSPAELL